MSLASNLMFSNGRPKFCYLCGRKLVRGYPGGNPENGPSQMQCPTGEHQTVDEAVENAMSDMSFSEHIEYVRNSVSMEVHYGAKRVPGLDAAFEQLIKFLKQFERGLR